MRYLYSKICLLHIYVYIYLYIYIYITSKYIYIYETSKTKESNRYIKLKFKLSFGIIFQIWSNKHEAPRHQT